MRITKLFLFFSYISLFIWSTPLLSAENVAREKGTTNSLLNFSKSEISTIVSFGPWPIKIVKDPSNLASQNPAAIRFGKQLFFDEGLSKNKNLSCASCHQVENHFADKLAVGFGIEALERNTPSLFNIGGQRWFGWGGESDSLWSHSIRPLLSVQEMATSDIDIQNYLLSNKSYQQTYFEVFGKSPENETAEQVLVNITKALAAYQETLITPRVAFDEFRDAIAQTDMEKAAQYPIEAQRGLKIFIGKGKCQLCHFSAKFSSGEFADIGIPFFTQSGVDSGRYLAIKALIDSPFNLLGPYNDSNKTDNQQKVISTQFVRLLPKNWGEFKVPSLRGIVHTSPYMHNGSLETLEDVINHYSTVSDDRIHSDGERIIQALNLSQQEVNDLISFLTTLSAPSTHMK